MLNLKQGDTKELGQITSLSQAYKIEEDRFEMELPSPTYKNCLLGQKMNENIALPTNKRKFTLVKNFTKYKISSHKALIFQ